MPKPGLLERLAEGPVLCDGSMILWLREVGPTLGVTPQQAYLSAPLNIEHPEVVEAVHRDYLDAGCELILTNTFHVTPYLMAERNVPYKTEQMVRAATAIARRAAGDQAWVLGDIGPLQPRHPIDDQEFYDVFFEQARALHDGGVDAIIVEYMSDPAEMAIAIKVSKQVSDRPVIATPVFGKTPEGEYRTPRPTPDAKMAWGPNVEEMIQIAIDAGADVVGTHCGQGLDLSDYLAMAHEIIATAQRPVIIQPNGAENVCPLGADVDKTEALAQAVPQFLDAGVRILGGCCGTRPDDLRAMAEAMRRWCQRRGVKVRGGTVR